jgi:aminoglycoside phosphotransferase (APT) family kinase protein
MDTEETGGPSGIDAASEAGGDGAVSLDAEHITRTTRQLGETADHLQRWLARTLGAGRNPVITGLTRPKSNGMSSETVLFSARWDEDGSPVERRLVARIEPPSTAYPLFTTYDLDMQFRVIRLVGEHTSVPVPETLWYEADRAVLGGPFFVMAQVDGAVPPDVLPYTFEDNWVFDAEPADRRRLQQSVITAVAGIHSITPDRFDLGFLGPDPASGPPATPGGTDVPGPASLERLVYRWRRYADWVVGDTPSPLLAECFAWLEEHRPDTVGADALSWGDGRIGNMMFRDFEVVAVLDWEMASVAPPEVDLGWLCYLHLFFHDIATDLGAPGLPDLFRPVDVAAAYAQLSGYHPVDLTWFVAFAAVRHGAIMRRVTERAIYFGEADMPDDVDDLILHRASLRAMLDGSYWERLAL